jgi:carboxyl-terminal processing protease
MRRNLQMRKSRVYPGLWAKSLSVGLIACLAVACAVSLGNWMLSALEADDRIPESAEPQFRLMAESWNTIQRVYVDRSALIPDHLAYGAISGMVDALGDTGHSRFLNPEMVKLEKRFNKGEFKGIGAELHVKDGHFVILAPLDNSPAQKAGLHPGDIIMKVNGRGISALSLDQVVERITGPVGTAVTLTILSPGTGRTRDVSIVRAVIHLHNVTWHQLPGTNSAHLRIAAFSEGVTRDLKKALKDIGQAPLKGIVLDLRNNPGGLLVEAIGTASQFLRQGNVLLEKDAKGRIKKVPVEPGGIATAVPMVVLINGGTASAAEIVSGALQDARRALLVGEKTFGTGTVLQEFSLSDGSALYLAVEEWLTPKGHVIWHKGIVPDQRVSLSPEAMPLMPSAEKGMTAEQLRASDDAQLLRALSLLTKETRKDGRTFAKGGLGGDRGDFDGRCQMGRAQNEPNR